MSSEQKQADLSPVIQVSDSPSLSATMSEARTLTDDFQREELSILKKEYQKLKTAYEKLILSLREDLSQQHDFSAHKVREKLFYLYQQIRSKERDRCELKNSHYDSCDLLQSRQQGSSTHEMQEVEIVRGEWQKRYNSARSFNENQFSSQSQNSQVWLQQNCDFRQIESVQEYKTLKDEALEILKTQLSNLRHQIKLNEMERDNLLEENKRLSHQCSFLVQQNQKVNEQLNQKSQLLLDFQMKYSQAEDQISRNNLFIQKLNSEIIEKKKQIIQNNEIIAQQSSTLEKYQEYQENLRQKIDEEKLFQYSSLIKTFKKEIQKKTDEISNLEKSFDESRRQNQEQRIKLLRRQQILQNQVEILKLKMKSKEMNLSQFERHIEKTEGYLQQEKKEKQAAILKLQKAEEQNKEYIIYFQGQIEQKQQKIQQFEQKCEYQRKEFEQKLKLKEEKYRNELHLMREYNDVKISRLQKQKIKEIEQIKHIARRRHEQKMLKVKAERNELKKKCKNLQKKTEESSFIWNKIYDQMQSWIVSTVKKVYSEHSENESESEKNSQIDSKGQSLFSFPSQLFQSDHLKESLKNLEELNKLSHEKQIESEQEIDICEYE